MADYATLIRPTHRGSTHATHRHHRPRQHERRTGARLRRRQSGKRHRRRAVLRLYPAAEIVRGSAEHARVAVARARRSLAVGIPQAVIDAINARKPPELPDLRERACHIVARELLANKNLTDATYAAAEKDLGTESLVAAVATTGSFSMTCMTANTFGIEPPADNPTPLAP